MSANSDLPPLENLPVFYEERRWGSSQRVLGGGGSSQQRIQETSLDQVTPEPKLAKTFTNLLAAKNHKVVVFFLLLPLNHVHFV